MLPGIHFVAHALGIASPFTLPSQQRFLLVHLLVFGALLVFQYRILERGSLALMEMSRRIELQRRLLAIGAGIGV